MRLRSLVATVAALSMAVPLAVAAEGDDTVGTAAFESLSVDVVDGEIVVAGSATFGGETIVVGQDATLDSTMPGADLEHLEITQDPSSGELTFEMFIADALPEVSSPPGNYFEWHVDIPGTDGVALRANRYEYDAPGAWVFSVTTFGTDPATGSGTFSSTDVPGEFTGSSLVWHVVPAALGAQPGSRLSQGSRGPVRSGLGLVGFVTFPGISHDDMMMDTRFGIGGGATVTVLDAAGEEVDEVDARVRRGEFSASVGDLDPGTYTVVVTTAYGDAKVSETFTVTI